MEFKVGDRVHFRIFKGCRPEKCENGIVKKIDNPQHLWVVYNCNNDWDNYQNYTAQKTSIVLLEAGWINK